MACPAIPTGAGFLVQTLSHLDCQAQTIGSLGYQALAAPGSPAAAVLTSLMTIFVALFGIRLMFGTPTAGRDLIDMALRVGIVLTLAFSWPAFKIVAYDTVIHGPAEVAATILPAADGTNTATLPQRLQAVDTGIATLTYVGTGRLTGAPSDRAPTASFRSIALSDEAALGWSRPIFLASIIGSLGTLRVAAGVLLAIAPLMAGLLLFSGSRTIFVGWVQGLFLTALASLGLTVLLTVQLAVMEPWLTDVGSRRSLGYSTPIAPTELLALVLGFTGMHLGLVAILARIAFRQTSGVISELREWRTARMPWAAANAAGVSASQPVIRTSAEVIRRSTEIGVRREAQSGASAAARRSIEPGGAGVAGTQAGPPGSTAVPPGSRYRRPASSTMRSQQQRDSRR